MQGSNLIGVINQQGFGVAPYPSQAPPEPGPLQESECSGSNSKRFRRSCDRCTAKKIRCDGTAQCQNCIKRGYACNYSQRKRTGPKIRTAADEHPEWLGAATRNGLVPWLNPDGTPAGGSQHEAPAAASTGPEMMYTAHPPYALPPAGGVGNEMGFSVGSLGVNPFAPNALSAHSTASLLGRAEGDYLEAFLAEINVFIPVLDEALVRSALVTLLSGGNLPVSTIMPLSPALAPEAAANVKEVQLQNAHNCILWSAIAVGALLTGKTEIEKYASLAWLSMKECFDLQNPSTISAYLVMSVLYQMLGDLDRFRLYLTMADGIMKELKRQEYVLPVEAEAVINYFIAGRSVEVKVLEAEHRHFSSMEMPPDMGQRHRILHLITRTKVSLVYNKLLSDANERQGLPRVPIDFPIVIGDLKEADRMLAAGPAGNGSYGLAFVRGLLGLLVGMEKGDVAASLEIMKPIFGIMCRCPGSMRIMPNYHYVHAFGMALFSVRDWQNYEMLQQIQASVPWGDCPILPPLDHNALEAMNKKIDDLCDHPVCTAMIKITAMARRRASMMSTTFSRKRSTDTALGEGQQQQPQQRQGPPAAGRGAGGGGQQGGGEGGNEGVESFFSDLSVDQIEQMADLFGSGSEFPTHLVF